MASSKKRRKQAALERRQRQAGSPARPHPDGDRRRRDLGIAVREALWRKQALRDGTLPPPEAGGDG
jgi:hypothetical protein